MRACPPCLPYAVNCLQITHFKGQRVAAEIPVWNPSFDVTPATLIEGIITERGLVPRQQPAAAAAAAAGSNGKSSSSSGSASGGGFAVRSWLAAATGSNGKQAAAAAAAPEAPTLPTLPGFRALDCSSIVDYVAGRPELAKHVGSPGSKGSWSGESSWPGHGASLRTAAVFCFCIGARHQHQQQARCLPPTPPFIFTYSPPCCWSGICSA